MLHLSEIARFVESVEASVQWYAAVLGLKPSLRSEYMAEFDLDGVILRLHPMYEPKPGELPPENHIAFTVEKLDNSCEQLRKAGVAIEVPPQEFPWGRSAYLRDPDGNVVELHEDS